MPQAVPSPIPTPSKAPSLWNAPFRRTTPWPRSCTSATKTKSPRSCGGFAYIITEQQRLGVHLEVVADKECLSAETELSAGEFFSVFSYATIMLTGIAGFDSRLFLPPDRFLGYSLSFRHVYFPPAFRPVCAHWSAKPIRNHRRSLIFSIQISAPYFSE